MSNLKNQQKKLFSHETTARIMQYFMGLNETNKAAMQGTAEKSSKKLVNTYFDAIKSQHKKALKAAGKKKNRKSTVAAPVVHARQTHLIAS